ncbi:unnamed protein product [Closterium sp. Naga37s-1]|nr:unnamed protein product [Closterium sp. Naga37s-1]
MTSVLPSAPSPQAPTPAVCGRSSPSLPHRLIPLVTRSSTLPSSHLPLPAIVRHGVASDHLPHCPIGPFLSSLGPLLSPLLTYLFPPSFATVLSSEIMSPIAPSPHSSPHSVRRTLLSPLLSPLAALSHLLSRRYSSGGGAGGARARNLLSGIAVGFKILLFCAFPRFPLYQTAVAERAELERGNSSVGSRWFQIHLFCLPPVPPLPGSGGGTGGA